MANIQQTKHGTILWLSARDTYDWAHRIGHAWPCSYLAGKRLRVHFDPRGDMTDYAVNGRYDEHLSNDVLTACATDWLAAYDPKHPAIRGNPTPMVLDDTPQIPRKD